jgi:hypothetical protein
MPPAALTIKLGDRNTFVSVAALSRALENALEMLRSLETDFAPSDSEVRWVVIQARMRSPLTLTIAPRMNGKSGDRIGKRIVTACLRGIEEIEASPTLPPHFKEETLTAAQKLISAAEREGTQLTLSTGAKHRVAPTPKALKHIEEIVARARVYLDYGTIEGNLEIVSVHEHMSFFIFEALTNYRVECVTSEEQFQRALSLLGWRVAVSGRIRYRNHKPTVIYVESVQVLRDSSKLPQPRDIGPIDITGGLSSEEHVRRMRDAR